MADLLNSALSSMGWADGPATARAVAGAIADAGPLGAASVLRDQLPFGARVQLAAAVVLVCGVYLSALRRVRAGAPRTAAALPACALTAALPLLFRVESEMVPSIVAILVSMCANLKTLAFCLDRGALVLEEWALVPFVFLLYVPVYPRHRAGGKKGRLSDSAGGARAMSAGFTGHMAMFVTCIALLSQKAFPLPAVGRYYACAFGMYGFISALMTGPGALLPALLGLDVVPPFDKPWLSTSLADYWSRRWNNSINLMLRTLVYDAIVERSLVRRGAGATADADAKGGKEKDKEKDAAAAAAAAAHRPSYALRITGVVATFVASGLVHEAMLAYIASPYRFGWSYFFLAQAPLVLAEQKFWAAVGRSGRKLHWGFHILVTQCLLVLTAHLFFFPPLEQWTQTGPKVISACADSLWGVALGVQALARQAIGAA